MIFEMDPLTAFGLAANVVSFVSFASGLIKTSVELYRSGSDTTSDILTLDKVYGDLRTLSSRLERTAHDNARPQVPTLDECEMEKTVLAVKGLAKACKEDCDKLLQITDKLRLRRGDFGSKWKSFRVAMTKVWKEGDIEEIEERLHQRQATLTLHVCTISRYCPSSQSYSYVNPKLSVSSLGYSTGRH